MKSNRDKGEGFVRLNPTSGSRGRFILLRLRKTYGVTQTLIVETKWLRLPTENIPNQKHGHLCPSESVTHSALTIWNVHI